MAKKERLDVLVVEQGLAQNQDIAKRLIMAGEIRTGDRVWEKAGEKIPKDTKLDLKSIVCKYVSKGALKLEKALSHFKIDPSNYQCLDIGSSTGGFTHVLLLNGAKKIVAVDVGYGLLDSKLRNNPKIELHERTNFRTLEDNHFQTKFDLIVTDVSFISLLSILPKATKMMKEDGKIIALIKPQFEAKRHQVPSGGIVKDPAVHTDVIERLTVELKQFGIYLNQITAVPLVSRKKNIEFVSLWTKENSEMSYEEITKSVTNAHNR